VSFAFHGTLPSIIPNIQRKGLLVPGTNGLSVVNGNAWGRGIYLASTPSTSLNYVRDQPKLIVCAVLEGDNQVTIHGNIRVAKDASYVLPCYIAHYSGSTPRSSSCYQRLLSHPWYHFTNQSFQYFIQACVAINVLVILLYIITLIYLVSFSLTGLFPEIYELCSTINTAISTFYVGLLCLLTAFLFGFVLYYTVWCPVYYLWFTW